MKNLNINFYLWLFLLSGLQSVSFDAYAKGYQGFYELLSKTHKNLPNNRELKKKLHILSNEFDKFQKTTNKSELKIPKIIHQIWISNKPMPKLYEKFRKTWKQKHPDWEYKLWTTEEIKKLNLQNIYYYTKTSDNREKADIARYEILYKFGGLYADLDTICLKAITNLHYSCNFYAGIQALNHHLINNAIIGAEPKNPIIKECINKIKVNAHQNNIWARTGPAFFTNVFFSCLDKFTGVNAIFPPIYFYPIPFGQKYNENIIDKYVAKETYVAHIWGNYNGFNQ